MTTNVKENRSKNKILVKFRIDRDLSQKNVAEKMNVSKETISRIERGVQDGSMKFWKRFKNEFNLSNEEIAIIMLGGVNDDTEEKSQD